MSRLVLTLTDAQLHALTTAAAKARNGTKKVSVDLLALEALIVDHTRALALIPHDIPVEGDRPARGVSAARRKPA